MLPFLTGNRLRLTPALCFPEMPAIADRDCEPRLRLAELSPWLKNRNHLQDCTLASLPAARYRVAIWVGAFSGDGEQAAKEAACAALATATSVRVQEW